MSATKLPTYCISRFGRKWLLAYKTDTLWCASKFLETKVTSCHRNDSFWERMGGRVRKIFHLYLHFYEKVKSLKFLRLTIASTQLFRNVCVGGIRNFKFFP